MTSEAGSAHSILLSHPDGAYSRLVNAQRFREQEEADKEDDDSITNVEKPAAVGTLTREQVDEMARNEKPQFETLKRTGTGRSAASEALSRKNKRDLESGALERKEHSFFYLGMRILKLNQDRWTDYIWAVAASILVGVVSWFFFIRL